MDKYELFKRSETVALDDENSALVIIDQTKLPYDVELISLKTPEQIFEAIKTLRVRGAPAIGVAAAIGIYILAKGIDASDFAGFYPEFKRLSDYLASSRPTAVNLSWALNRMDKCAKAHCSLPINDIKEALKSEALVIRDEDINVCRSIGKLGLSLIKDGYGILTHCNAGRLAAVKYGTATAPIYVGMESGMKFRVFSDETRPLLQGARLTSFELAAEGADVTLICDNMAASVMSQGLVNAVFVGCDRVAANGDTANKIGTYGVAIMAKHFNIPMYICAPTATIDMKCATGADIPIEYRDGDEITNMWYAKPMADKNIKTVNPAFDVTDSSLISAIITEYGICYPPFTESIAKIMKQKGEI